MPSEIGVPKLTPEQRVELMELVVTQSLSQRQAVGIWERRSGIKLAPTTIGRIVKDELSKVAEQRDTVIASHRSQMDLQIDALIRTALPIALGSKCSVCAGEKVIKIDRLDPDSENQVCPKCDGSGRNETDSVRLSAVNTIKGLLERRSKLHGLDAPEQLEHMGVMGIVDASKMDNAELQGALTDFFRPGVQSDGRVLRELTEGARTAGNGKPLSGTALSPDDVSELVDAVEAELAVEADPSAEATDGGELPPESLQEPAE